jgi:chloramphenicol 3-O phosphotransferase
MPEPGRIVVLNGAPRSGKSSIVRVIQETFDGPWMNLGVDTFVRSVTPPRYRPGIGLRPGGERQDLQPLIPILYGAMYESIAAHSRLGLNVVVDVGHYDAPVLRDCARRLAGLPTIFVGVRCPIEVIMKRRKATWGQEIVEGEGIPVPVRRWQDQVHVPGIYDLEVDTAELTPEECARRIRLRLESDMPGVAFGTLGAARS